MAEQEACTDLVEKASQEQSGEQIEGESLLLPLLQGLLEAPENEQPADSGTESGEDQRSGLIAEVQNALDKLSASLRSDATDITSERRCSLLQLVTKLQAGLSTTTPKLERRQSSGPGRFNRKKQRQNRHTVGVSSEELADARRLMEEISLRDITPSHSQTKVTVLQKQNSESSVNSNSSSFNKFSSKGPVKNAVAKPFSTSSNSNISNTSSSIQTPTDPAETFDLIFNEDLGQNDTKESKSVSKTSSKSSVDQEPIKPSPLSQATSLEEVNIKAVHKAVQQAAARKKGNSESAQESETEEDDTSTVTAPKETTAIPPPSPLLENPIYSHPENIGPTKTYEEKCRRFNTPSNKLRMKRANTVDIPNSLNIYQDDDDSDAEDEAQQRRNSYYALRGPIRVGDPVKKTTMPVFEPKTESDQKFLAFINKNNQNNSQTGSLWSANQSKTSVWRNKFGNIKNNFEKASNGPSNNSARSFWKSADDAVTSGNTLYGPTISRRSARNLQQMYEEKQRQSQEKRQNDNQGVVTGTLTVKTEPDKNYKFIPQPQPVNMFSHAPQSAFKPIQKKVVEKPETLPVTLEQDLLKTEIKENKNDPPLYLYSPKPLYNSQTSSTASSPIVSSKPWLSNPTEHGGRVLSMAAKKFEAPPEQENHIIKPRKLNKDKNKVFIPQPTTPEKMTAPYLVKGVDQRNSTVRKLSDQYDSLENKPLEYTTQSSVRYQLPQEKKSYVPKYTVPQGMCKPPQNTVAPYQPNHNQYNSSPQYTHSQVQKPQQTYQAQTKAPTQQISPTQHYQIHSQAYTQIIPPPQTQTQTQNNTQKYTQAIPPTYQAVNQSTRYDQQNNIQRAFEPYNPTQSYQPVNYSITYDKNRIETQPQPELLPQNVTQPNYTLQANVQQTHQIYQHVPGQEIPQYEHQPQQEYTSTCQFTPQTNNTQIKPSIQVQSSEPAMRPPKLETQISNESVCEYTAISSKVMTGPVSQQAVTVRQKSPMNRNEHDMEAAFNLKNSLQKVGRTDSNNTSKSPSNSFSYKSSEPKTASPNNSFKSKQSQPPAQQVSTSNSFKYGSTKPKPLSPVRYNPEAQETSQNIYNKYNPNDVPKPTVCPSSFKFKSADQFPQKPTGNENKTFGVVKPMQQKPTATTPIYNNVSGKVKQSLEINEKGQSVVTSKFNIPVINVKNPSTPNTPTVGQGLSKSDSWYQICMASQNQNSKPSPSTSPTGRPVMRSKSSNTLAVPQKQFEAGMSREELVQKQKTIEAYFSSGTKSSQPSDTGKNDAKVVKRSINRVKTSEKVSAYRQSSGLCRSRTLPDIICPEMLDESNPDKAFDDLFKSSS